MTTGPESTDRRVAREPEPTDTGTSARPTEPAASRPAEPAATRPAVEDTPDVNTKGGKTAGLWISLILGAVVLILLLIFVIQNNVKATFGAQEPGADPRRRPLNRPGDAQPIPRLKEDGERHEHR